MVPSSELVVASWSFAELGTAQPHLVFHRIFCSHFVFCRRCGVAGGEPVPPSPPGWYFHGFHKWSQQNLYLVTIAMSYPDFLKGGTGIVISGAKMLIDKLVCGWNCLTPVQSPDFSLGTRSLRCFTPVTTRRRRTTTRTRTKICQKGVY